MFGNYKPLKVAVNIVVFISSLLLVSCGHVHVKMDPGDNVDKGHNAYIQVANDEFLSIRSVDGVDTVNYFGRLMNNHRYASSVDITPGKHELLLQYSWNNSFSHSYITFIAEPDRKYLVRAKAVGYSIQYWIENSDTGKNVDMVGQ